MPFLMIRDDITKVAVDAIVNPANEELLEGSGTSRSIYLKAGEEKLGEACKQIGHCNLGEAVITEGFDLLAKYIIHAVNPIWLDGNYGEEKLLYKTYTQALFLAKQHQLESIAFPLLSSGNYHFPKDKALKIAVSAISDFLIENEMLVYLVLYDNVAFTISKKLFSSIEEYIDDHYIETNNEKIYQINANASYRRSSTTIINKTALFFQEPVEMANQVLVKAKKDYAPSRSLDSLIGNIGDTFSTMLLRLIDERGLKDAYVYKKANIDRRLFSKIRNNINYEPSKKTVLAFAIALELSLDETKDLLMRAGYAFSNCSKFDIIICYFIENKQYDIYLINEMLFAYNQPLLGA